MHKKRRDKKIMVWVSADEKSLIESNAKKARRNLSDFIRVSATDKK